MLEEGIRDCLDWDQLAESCYGRIRQAHTSESNKRPKNWQVNLYLHQGRFMSTMTTLVSLLFTNETGNSTPETIQLRRQ